MKHYTIRKLWAIALLVIAVQASGFTPDKSAEKTIEESTIAIMALIQKYPTEAERAQGKSYRCDGNRPIQG